MIKHGNVGRDPEMRYFESGKCKTSFSLAVRKEDAESLKKPIKDRETEWLECEIWGDLGEAFAETVRKGAQVVVVGDAYTDTYTKDGETRTKKCINVVWFATPSLGKSAPKPKPAAKTSESNLDALFASEEEIPF